jgi:aspartate/methionine/tyrosine aminotransferase
MARGVQLSATMAVDAKVRRLRDSGCEVVDLGAGQPDFPTPEEVCDAGIEAIRRGKTRYTPAQGEPGLREVVAQICGQRRGVPYEASEVLVSSGAKHALFMALASILEPGDEVLIPTPCWVTYPEQVRMLGAAPRFVGTRHGDGFHLDLDALRAACTSRTKCLILNTPCNPTGTVYGAEELREVARLVQERDLWLVTDEIYEGIVFRGHRHQSPVSVEPVLRERTAVISGVSKAYAMTGWRLGYMLGPRRWVQAATALQSHMTGNACSISQEAARAALSGSQAASERMRATFEARRDLLVRELGQIPGCRCAPPEGTFYAFVDVRTYLGTDRGGARVETTADLVEYLLDEARVAVVAGEAFQAPGFVRISFAASEEQIQRGLRGMAAALGRLQGN